MRKSVMEEAFHPQFQGIFPEKYDTSSHELYPSICERFTNLSSMTLKELSDLKDDMFTIRNDVQRRNGLYFMPQPDTAEIIEIKKEIAKRTPLWYTEPVYKEDDFRVGIDCGLLEQVVLPIAREPDITYDIYLYLKGFWNTHEMRESWEDFFDWFQKNTCTDWCKQDVKGVCYGGPWAEKESNPERYENAWYICLEDNAKALYALHYPLEFIKKTIKMGCNSRQESVPYTVYLCEWMRRKSYQEMMYVLYCETPSFEHNLLYNPINGDIMDCETCNIWLKTVWKDSPWFQPCKAWEAWKNISDDSLQVGDDVRVCVWKIERKRSMSPDSEERKKARPDESKRSMSPDFEGRKKARLDEYKYVMEEVD